MTLKSHAIKSKAGCDWSKLSAFHKFMCDHSQSHVTFELNYASQVRMERGNVGVSEVKETMD